MNDNIDDLQQQEFSNSEDEVLLPFLIIIGRNSAKEEKEDWVGRSIEKEENEGVNDFHFY